MNDMLIASPAAISNNELLGSLDHVASLDMSGVSPDAIEETVSELPEAETRSLPESVSDPILNVWLQSFKIRLEDPMFGGLVNPGILDDSMLTDMCLVGKIGNRKE
jgi:hypothetical protein